MTDQVRVAVMASGRGSNFRAIHRRLNEDPHAPATIVVCISNNPNPGAFEYAREHGVEVLRLSPRMFDSEDDYAAALLDALTSRRIEMIVLAGYMRKIPDVVVERYHRRILNVHPALLPEFGGEGMYGMHVHEAVIASGARESGATVHLVDAEYDTGPTIAQERIAISEGETPEKLAARVLEVEHRLFPRVVIEWARQMIAERDIATESKNNND